FFFFKQKPPTRIQWGRGLNVCSSHFFFFFIRYISPRSLSSFASPGFPSPFFSPRPFFPAPLPCAPAHRSRPRTGPSTPHRQTPADVSPCCRLSRHTSDCYPAPTRRSLPATSPQTHRQGSQACYQDRCPTSDSLADRGAPSTTDST